MPKFFATGIKRCVVEELNEKGKTVKNITFSPVVIDPDPENYGFFSRTELQNKVNAIAKRNDITLDGYGIRIVKGTERGGNTLTKFAKKRKLEVTKRHQANRRKNLKKLS